MNSGGVTSIICKLQMYVHQNNRNKYTVVFNCQYGFLIIATFKVVNNGKPSRTKDDPSK